MRIKLLLRENIQQYWYNGSERPRLQWTTENVGKGNDQNGPGLYFTTSEQSAKAYGKYIHKVILNFEPKRICPLNGKLNTTFVQKLIKSSPDAISNLQNWDEDPRRAIVLATKSILQYGKGKFDMLQQIWYDFYRYNPVEFLKNVSTIYDGAIVNLDNEKHAIVFNPAIIQTINTQE